MKEEEYKVYENARNTIYEMLHNENTCNDCTCNIMSAIIDAVVFELGNDAKKWVKDSIKIQKELDKEVDINGRKNK